MLRAEDRSYTRVDTWLFLACLGLAVVGLFSPPAWGASVAMYLRDSVLAPLVWLQERAEEGRTSRARFAAVTAQRDSTAYIAQNLPALEAENVRLRQLLRLGRRLGSPYVAAEVLHQAQATDGRTLLLSAGRAEGVGAFDPVVSPEGLVGVVLNAGEHSSLAMTWAHPEFRVSAYTANGAIGLVAPATAGTASEASLELRGVPYRDSIPDGMLVISSGLGGVYPRGIPLGSVVGVAREQRGWERVYRLRPAGNPSVASHVLILTMPRDSAVTDAFPTDSILRALAADSAARQAAADSVLRRRIADSAIAAYRDSLRRAVPDTSRAAGRAAAPTPATPRPAAPRPVAPKPEAPRPEAPAPVRPDSTP